MARFTDLALELQQQVVTESLIATKLPLRLLTVLGRSKTHFPAVKLGVEKYVKVMTTLAEKDLAAQPSITRNQKRKLDQRIKDLRTELRADSGFVVTDVDDGASDSEGPLSDYYCGSEGTEV